MTRGHVRASCCVEVLHSLMWRAKYVGERGSEDVRSFLMKHIDVLEGIIWLVDKKSNKLTPCDFGIIEPTVHVRVGG